MANLLIRGGLVHDAVNETPYIADILCENGKIAVTELHPENGKRMTAAAFLAGNKL